MAHTVEVVKYEKLSNGQVAMTLRCCGDQSTDHVHTMAVSVASNVASLKASLDPQRVFLANQHQSALDTQVVAMGEIGNVTTHD